MDLARISDRLRTGLWFVPLLLVAAWLTLAFGTPAVDRRVSFVSITDDPDTARELLATAATATVTFAGLVFSITIVALQLTSSQFSPRVLRQFLRDRPSQLALGTFVGVFLYDLVVLAEISGPPKPFVPDLAVDVAMVASGVSVLTFIGFVSHITQSIRAVRIIDAVTAETRRCADRLPRQSGSDPAPVDVLAGLEIVGEVTRSGNGAVLQDVDVHHLVVLARRHDVVFHLVDPVGDFVPGGARVIEVLARPDRPAGKSTTVDTDDVLDGLGFGPERTMTSDVAFGYRQLADIGEKALSPALNDPTTALQCIDRLHDLLRAEAVRPRIARIHADDDGVVRVVNPAIDWDELIELAFDEIRLYGSGSIQVVRRIRAALDDLRTVAGAYVDAVDEQLGLLDRAVRRSFPDPVDRRRAGMADEQGLGDDGD